MEDKRKLWPRVRERLDSSRYAYSIYMFVMMALVMTPIGLYLNWARYHAEWWPSILFVVAIGALGWAVTKAGY